MGIHWPAELGGRDAGIPEQIAYVEEMARARAPEVIGDSRNRDRRAADHRLRHRGAEGALPAAHPVGEDLWCFGFSEPGAGSDLASLRTQAVLDGDHFA